MQDALKEQALIMQEAHRKYRQQKQAKFNQEMSVLRNKYQQDLDQERMQLVKQDKKIADLLNELDVKRDQTEETLDEELAEAE